jgi:hypothetical protein
MDFTSINWLAVLACVVASMISGMIWYNPKTFFMIWWKGIGKTGDPMRAGQGSMGVIWTMTVLSSLVQGVFMALMVTALGGLMGGPSVATGLLTGLVLWAGFIAPTYLVNKLFAGHGFKVWAIEAGNHLVNFLAFGAILGAWR